VDVGRVGLADEHAHVGVQVAILLLAVRRVAVKDRARLSPLPCAVVEAGQVALPLLLGDLEAPHLLREEPADVVAGALALLVQA
tara:strand:+ start:1230 stop:1481 length:252 start_codon:yes stop_codon:yes gene_type:complete